MTMDVPLTTRRRPGVGTLVGYAGLFALGAAVAAWFDWTYWHPSSQLAYVFVAPVVLVIGIVLAAIRRLPMLLRFGTIPLVIGLIAGGLLGPSRPPTTSHDASIRLRLTSPVVAEATGSGGCVTVEAGDQLYVFGDQDLRVGADVDELAVGFSLSYGDMYGDPRGRADRLDLLVLVMQTAIPIEEDGFPSETRMISAAGSELEADVEGLEGFVSFDGLVVAPPESGSSQNTIDLVGTIEWTCEP